MFKIINSCEDPHIQYLETRDGLRLILMDGEYIGFYYAGDPNG